MLLISVRYLTRQSDALTAVPLAQPRMRIFARLEDNCNQILFTPSLLNYLIHMLKNTYRCYF